VSTNLPGQQIIDAIASQIMTLGVFDQVNAHDPVSPPGDGITAAVWVQKIKPVGAASGLDAASLLFVVNVRVYMLARTEPIDLVDPLMTGAVDQAMSTIADGFTLGALVRNVDLLGQYGVDFDAQYGYVTMSGSVYRAATITIPTVINDVWTEEA
jgi:hypothetical protein